MDNDIQIWCPQAGINFLDASNCFTPAANDSQSFSQTEIDEIVEIVAPYIARGVLSEMYFKNQERKIITAHYAASGLTAFELTHDLIKPKSGAYRLSLYGLHSFDANLDFDRAKKALKLFMNSVFPASRPTLSVV